MNKIETDGGIRQAAEDSAFRQLGSSDHAHHDRLVYFSAFLDGAKWAGSELGHLSADNAKLREALKQVADMTSKWDVRDNLKRFYEIAQAVLADSGGSHD